MRQRPETERLAEQLRHAIQERLHEGLEATTLVSPGGDAVRVDVFVAAEAETRHPWSRHVLVTDFERDEEQLEAFAKLLAERASRAWTTREAEG